MAQNATRPLKVTWAHAWRDIAIRLIDKGAILPAMIAAVVIIMVAKLEPAESKEVILEVVSRLASGELVGWIVVVFLIMMWQLHARLLRKQFSVELQRVGEQKSKAQRAASGQSLKSSNSKRVQGQKVTSGGRSQL